VAYLAEQRDKIFVPALGVAEIGVSFDNGALSASLFCVTCSYEFDLSDERGLYECSDCGVEVTKEEAEDLAEKHILAVAKKFDIGNNESDRGFWWRLKTLFGGTKKRQALLKP